MKSGNSKGLSFGFSSVIAGQRAAGTVTPQVIAVSTPGSFRLTAPVSSVLGLQHGDYLMFLSNVKEIDDAIRDKHPDIVAFTEEAGLAIDSPEAYVALHKEFDKWGVSKGIIEYDPKGNKREVTERLSRTDRVRFVSQNFETMLESALSEGDEELREALTKDGITKDEQIEILAPFVTPKTVTKYRGSKLANMSGHSGTGVALCFTDSNVWSQLKADLKEDASKLGRHYELDLDNIQTVTISNGYEPIDVKVLILGDYKDKKPIRLGDKDEDEEIED
jgi:hypothetical protein